MADEWFSLGTPVSSINKTDSHDKTEVLLKVALNTIALAPADKKKYQNGISRSIDFLKNYIYMHREN